MEGEAVTVQPPSGDRAEAGNAKHAAIGQTACYTDTDVVSNTL